MTTKGTAKRQYARVWIILARWHADLSGHGWFKFGIECSHVCTPLLDAGISPYEGGDRNLDVGGERCICEDQWDGSPERKVDPLHQRIWMIKGTLGLTERRGQTKTPRHRELLPSRDRTRSLILLSSLLYNAFALAASREGALRTTGSPFGSGCATLASPRRTLVGYWSSRRDSRALARNCSSSNGLCAACSPD